MDQASACISMQVNEALPHHHTEDHLHQFVRVEQPLGRFAFIIPNCPPSLKLLVRVFRFFLFSFSGIIFQQSSSPSSSFENIATLRLNYSNGHLSTCKRKLKFVPIFKPFSRKISDISQIRNPIYRARRKICWKIRCQSFLMLTLHICFAFSYFMHLIFDEDLKQKLDGVRKRDAERRSGTTTNQTISLMYGEDDRNPLNLSHGFAFSQIFDENRHFEDINNLKPILRNIIHSIMYVFMLDGFMSSVANLVLGGRLVASIAAIPDIHQLDRDRKLAVRLLLAAYGIITLFSLLGFVIFINVHLGAIKQHIYGGINEQQQSFSRKDVFLLINVLCVTLMHQFHYVVLSITTILFVYAMLIIRDAIDAITQSFRTELTESQLHLAKLKLLKLNAHFKSIIGYMSLPIIASMASNTFMLVASSCFLMIHQPTSNDLFVMLIFNLGTFAFIRLVVLCCAGTLPSTSFRRLLITAYEAMPEWNCASWLCFVQIKQLSPQFAVHICCIFTLRQSTILAVLVFALNHIVILLQTENYANVQHVSSHCDNHAHNLNLHSINSTLCNSTLQ